MEMCCWWPLSACPAGVCEFDSGAADQAPALGVSKVAKLRGLETTRVVASAQGVLLPWMFPTTVYP